ncbi:MAG: glycosyltransferase [Planctomycetota bacterium]
MRAGGQRPLSTGDVAEARGAHAAQRLGSERIERMSDEGRPLTLGVIVCCRDEERVIERRLRNLARSIWPESSSQHRVVVVDDGSLDKTVELAAVVGAETLSHQVRLEVIPNRFRPGKCGAIESAIAHLGQGIDVIVLTDADVIHPPDAMLELARRFEARPALGMVTARQRFVRSMRADGNTGPATLVDVGGMYDRCTSWVRMIESMCGRTFSVHGQLLAWRANLCLVPDPDLMADDLDLMRQVRLRGLRVEQSNRARFFELKLKGEPRRNQAVRRVRAFLQFARTLDVEAARDPITRWQWRYYRHVPAAYSLLAGVAFLFLIAGVLTISVAVSGERFHLALQVPAWLILLGIGRRLWWIHQVVAESKRLELSPSANNQWSTAR